MEHALDIKGVTGDVLQAHGGNVGAGVGVIGLGASTRVCVTVGDGDTIKVAVLLPEAFAELMNLIDNASAEMRERIGSQLN